VKTVDVPYASWYRDAMVSLTFPEGWEVTEARPRGARTLSDEEVRERFASPIGTGPISELARGARSAVLIVDDITRPTPASRVLPIILEELERGGLGEDRVWVVMATAAHRPLGRVDLERKLGREVVERLEVFNHNPYENLEYLGATSQGTPIHVNRHVMEADLKVGVGGIYPHPMAGFGGGAKIILPGVAGMDTIEANHRTRGAGLGVVEGNRCRADMEEAASKAGLDIIVNLLVNSRREVAGVFVGDMVEAHRVGVKLAEAVYGTRMPTDVDLAVVNAYPMDTELFQAGKGLWAGVEATREDGTIVLLAACSEGRGYHALVQKGGRLWRPPASLAGRRLGGRRLMIVSPNLSLKDVRQNYPRETSLFGNWDEALRELRKDPDHRISVAVFPCAPIQVPA